MSEEETTGLSDEVAGEMEKLQSELKELQEKFGKVQTSKDELDKKYGTQSQEVGDLRKTAEGLEKTLEEKEQALEELKQEKQKFIDEAGKKDDDKELRSMVEKQLKQRFAALPKLERENILKSMTEEDWKKLEEEYIEKVKSTGYVPDYMKDLVSVETSEASLDDNAVLQEARKAIGLAVAEKNATPPGGGASPSGAGNSPDTEIKRKYPEGGLNYLGAFQKK